MKRKFTFLLMALLTLAGFKSWGQENITVQIGTDVENQYSDNYPFYSYYKYSYNQMLYKQTEIGAAGIINSISFHADYDNQSGSRTYSFDIYMKNVDREDFSSWSDWESVTAADKVGSGTIASSTTGWVEFTLLTPFYYDGTSNLMIAIDNNTGSYGHKLFYHTYTVGSLAHMVYSDDTNFDPLNPPTSGYNGGVHTFRPNIKLNITPGQLTSYNITYDQTIQHGSITGPATAFANQTVTLTATPAENYALDHFTVDGLAIQGKTFTMPEHDVTVSATFKQVFTLTVNDGTTIDNNYVPFYGYYANYYPTKSEFVIPAGVLETMEGGIISGLTFYTSDYTNNHDFQGASWDIYLKEADYTMPGGVDGYTYTNLASMTKVYSGSLSVTNHQVTIVFDNPFVYNSQNLVISFQQTSLSTLSSNVQWIGKTEGTEMRSRGGYYKDFTFPSGSPSSYASKPFLPKTTFTYIPGETYTVTVIQPATGGGIDANPKTDVTSGTTVTLSATPETGYDLSEWIVTNVTTSQPITVTNNQFTMPDSDVTVTATFAQLIQHNVNISQSIEHGTVTASPSACYKGETVTLTFEPASGYANPNYNDIIVTDASSGSVDVQYDYITGNYYFIMPNSDVTVFATFNRLYNISLGSYEHGEVSTYPADNAVYEASVNISVKPDAGYQISSITVDYEGGQITPDYWGLFGEYHTYNFTMPAYDVTVNVSITEIPHYNVSIGDIANGTVAIVGETSYMAGETVSLNVQPAAGYELESITATPETGDPITPSFDGNYYTFTMPASNVTVSATFVNAITVYDGTTTNDMVPIYGSYADSDYKSQFIFPAEELDIMAGGTINSMTFYASQEYVGIPGTWSVYVSEVENTTLSGLEDWSGLNAVLQGATMTISGYQMTVNFTTPFQYNGGNLLVGFNETISGSYIGTTWYGVNQTTNTAYYRYYYHQEYKGTIQFLPKTTFTYTPGYNITCDDAITGGSISADRVKAAAGTVVTLSATPAFGYEFGAWVEDYEDVTIENNQFTMPEHNVTISATFNELTKYAINSADVTGGTVHAEYDNVTITEAPEGTVITLVAEAAEDYIFEYFTVDGVQIEGSTYTIGTSDITIGASFREVQSYTIHYYVNGYNNKNDTKKETQTINITSPYGGLVPAGTEFFGWSFDDIATYQTEEPSIIGEGVHPTRECNVYAVFKCLETVISDNWEPIWTAPQNGEDVIFANNIWSEEYQRPICYVMCDRSFSTIPYFSSGECTVDTYGNIISTPENVTVFNVEILGNGNLKFHFNDISQGESTLADLDGSSLVPQSLWGGVDTWVNDWGTIYNTSNSSDYISCYENSGLIFCINTYNYSRMYRRATEENSYYMTEALGYGGADEHIASNTSATNVVIANNAKLTVDNGATLDVEGICLNPSHDAAQLVIAEGGQLIHNNTGVLATMKKNITGTEWYTISSPLANSVEFANVENLIPSSGVTGTDYDLYRLNEAEGIWENSRIENQAQNEFTTIDKGLGYIYANNAGADHIAFAGEVNVADAECTLTNGKTNGFNLIGNPFTQNIELANVTGVTLAEGFYVLNNDNTWATEPITTGTIAPLQGFLVQATTAGTATISKPTAAPSKGERSEQNTNIEMIVSNSIYRDNAFAMFGEGTGLNKVNHRNAQAPMLYVPQDGEKFAIAFMDENTTVFPLNFKAMTTGKYSISLKATDDINTLVLVDNMTGVETNMLLENSYSFNGSPADSEGRFTVKLSISHSNGQSDNEHFVYQNGSELVVNGEGTLQVFDVLGRVVISEEVHGQTVYVGNLSEGAYIVRMTGNEIKTQKIIIR